MEIDFVKLKLEIQNSAENSEKPEMTPGVLLYCDVCDFTTPTKVDLHSHQKKTQLHRTAGWARLTGWLFPAFLVPPALGTFCFERHNFVQKIMVIFKGVFYVVLDYDKNVKQRF